MITVLKVSRKKNDLAFMIAGDLPRNSQMIGLIMSGAYAGTPLIKHDSRYYICFGGVLTSMPPHIEIEFVS